MLLLTLQEQFKEKARKKVLQSIKEEDLWVDGGFMSEQDMIEAKLSEQFGIILSFVIIEVFQGSGGMPSRLNARRSRAGFGVRPAVSL